MNKVSIITPYYNSSQFFMETFQSVVSQTHKNWEWLIVDDGSTEKERDYLKKLAKSDKRVRVILLEHNVGAGLARNKALKQEMGDFVSFIDSDDTWDNDFLECMLKEIAKYDVDFIYGGYRRLHFNGRISRFIPKKKHNSHNILRGCDISCLSTLIKTKSKPINAQFGLIAARNDLIFFHTLLINSTGYPVSLIKAGYRIHNGSISKNKMKLIKFQWYASRKIAKKSIFISIINMIGWIAYGLKKYYF